MGCDMCVVVGSASQKAVTVQLSEAKPLDIFFIRSCATGSYIDGKRIDGDGSAETQESTLQGGQGSRKHSWPHTAIKLHYTAHITNGVYLAAPVPIAFRSSYVPCQQGPDKVDPP